MSNSHFSGYAYRLGEKIQELEAAIPKESLFDLKDRFNTCQALLNLIIDQAETHGQDISGILPQVNAARNDLQRLEQMIKDRPKTFWESLAGFFSDIFDSISRLLGMGGKSDRLLGN